MATLNIVTSINEYGLQREFKRMDRDYYSAEACNVMLEWMGEIHGDEPVDLDIIELCGLFTEYDSVESLLDDYSASIDGDGIFDEDGDVNEDVLIEAFDQAGYTLTVLRDSYLLMI